MVCYNLSTLTQASLVYLFYRLNGTREASVFRGNLISRKEGGRLVVNWQSFETFFTQKIVEYLKFAVIHSVYTEIR